ESVELHRLLLEHNEPQPLDQEAFVARTPPLTFVARRYPIEQSGSRMLIIHRSYPVHRKNWRDQRAGRDGGVALTIVLNVQLALLREAFSSRLGAEAMRHEMIRNRLVAIAGTENLEQPADAKCTITLTDVLVRAVRIGLIDCEQTAGASPDLMQETIARQGNARFDQAVARGAAPQRGSFCAPIRVGDGSRDQ